VGAEDLADVVSDPDAFEAFYRRHVTVISRFLARRVVDPQLVADLTAEVFHEVIRSAHTYRAGRGSEFGWLYGIARNVLANDRRREGLRLRAERGAAGQRMLDDDDIARLEERIDAESAARRLRLALSALPESERAVVELVAVDGLSLKDAAAALASGREPRGCGCTGRGTWRGTRSQRQRTRPKRKPPFAQGPPRLAGSRRADDDRYQRTPRALRGASPRRAQAGSGRTAARTRSTRPGGTGPASS
jgi:RNA polymerase sigma factor (sigma-70 family)